MPAAVTVDQHAASSGTPTQSNTLTVLSLAPSTFTRDIAFMCMSPSGPGGSPQPATNLTGNGWNSVTWSGQGNTNPVLVATKQLSLGQGTGSGTISWSGSPGFTFAAYWQFSLRAV